MEEKVINQSPKTKTKKINKLKEAAKNIDKKKRRTIYIVIAAIIVVALGSFFLVKAIRYNTFSYQTILQLEERIGKPDEKWTVSTTDPSVATAEFRTDAGFEGYSLVIDFHKPSSTDLIVKNGDGQEFRYGISITQDEVIDVQSK